MAQALLDYAHIEILDWLDGFSKDGVVFKEPNHVFLLVEDAYRAHKFVNVHAFDQSPHV